MAQTQTPWFERSVSAEHYVHALSAAYQAGYRIYDPSHALSKQADAEQVIRRDADIEADLEFRHMSVAGRKWTIAPADEGERPEKDLARIVGQAFGHIQNFTQARLNLAGADLSGARYAEVVRSTVTETFGDRKPRTWVVPVALKDMPKARFRWQRENPLETGPGDRVRTVLESYHVASRTWRRVPDGAPLVAHVVGDAEERLGYGRGMIEALYYWHLAKEHVLNEWMSAGERFGQGQIVLKMRSDKSGDYSKPNSVLVTNGLATLDRMRARHGFIIDRDDSIELLQPNGEGAKILSELYALLQKACSRLILAAILPTGGGDPGVGSNARAREESESTGTIIDAMGDLLEETLTRHLVRPFVRDNHANLEQMGLAAARPPRFLIVRGKRQDPLTAMDIVEKAQRAGVKLKKDEVYDRISFTKPGPDDEILEPAPVAFPALGPRADREDGDAPDDDQDAP